MELILEGFVMSDSPASTRILMQAAGFSTKQTNKNMILHRQLILSQRKEIHNLLWILLILFVFWRTSEAMVLGTRR